MNIIISETYLGRDFSGSPIKFTIRVTSPAQHVDGGFVCSIFCRTEVASEAFEEPPIAVTGLTTRRALGEALLLTDSMLDLRVLSQGPWTLSSQGEPYNLYLHSAVPREMFEMQSKVRDASRQHFQSVG